MWSKQYLKKRQTVIKATKHSQSEIKANIVKQFFQKQVFAQKKTLKTFTFSSVSNIDHLPHLHGRYFKYLYNENTLKKY